MSAEPGVGEGGTLPASGDALRPIDTENFTHIGALVYNHGRKMITIADDQGRIKTTTQDINPSVRPEISGNVTELNQYDQLSIRQVSSIDIRPDHNASADGGLTFVFPSIVQNSNGQREEQTTYLKANDLVKALTGQGGGFIVLPGKYIPDETALVLEEQNADRKSATVFVFHFDDPKAEIDSSAVLTYFIDKLTTQWQKTFGDNQYLSRLGQAIFDPNASPADIAIFKARILASLVDSASGNRKSIDFVRKHFPNPRFFHRQKTRDIISANQLREARRELSNVATGEVRKDTSTHTETQLTPLEKTLAKLKTEDAKQLRREIDPYFGEFDPAVKALTETYLATILGFIKKPNTDLDMKHLLDAGVLLEELLETKGSQSDTVYFKYSADGSVSLESVDKDAVHTFDGRNSRYVGYVNGLNSSNNRYDGKWQDQGYDWISTANLYGNYLETAISFLEEYRIEAVRDHLKSGKAHFPGIKKTVRVDEIDHAISRLKVSLTNTRDQTAAEARTPLEKTLARLKTEDAKQLRRVVDPFLGKSTESAEVRKKLQIYISRLFHLIQEPSNQEDLRYLLDKITLLKELSEIAGNERAHVAFNGEDPKTISIYSITFWEEQLLSYPHLAGKPIDKAFKPLSETLGEIVATSEEYLEKYNSENKVVRPIREQTPLEKILDGLQTEQAKKLRRDVDGHFDRLTVGARSFTEIYLTKVLAFVKKPNHDNDLASLADAVTLLTELRTKLPRLLVFIKLERNGSLSLKPSDPTNPEYNYHNNLWNQGYADMPSFLENYIHKAKEFMSEYDTNA